MFHSGSTDWNNWPLCWTLRELMMLEIIGLWHTSPDSTADPQPPHPCVALSCAIAGAYARLIRSEKHSLPHSRDKGDNCTKARCFRVEFRWKFLCFTRPSLCGGLQCQRFTVETKRRCRLQLFTRALTLPRLRASIAMRWELGLAWSTG